jgi:hypothetical protein
MSDKSLIKERIQNIGITQNLTFTFFGSEAELVSVALSSAVL